MAGNILKAVIDVSAPGAKAVFEEIASLSKSVDKELSALGKNGELNFKSINAALKTFKDLLSRATDPKDITKLNLAIGSLQNKLKDIPPSAEKMYVAVDKVHGSTVRAANASLRLGHTFGLLPGHSSHVAHGLETIMHTFERLKEQTGSSEKAFKGLFTSIAGSVGIGLAIAGFTLLISKLFDTKEGLKTLEEQFDSVKDSIDSMNDSLRSTGEDLDFLRQVAKLRAEIGGSKGAVLDLLDLNQQKTNNQILKDQIEDDLKEIEEKVSIGLDKINVLAKLKGIDLNLTTKGLIPESVINDQEKQMKVFFNTFNELAKEKNKLNDDLLKNSQKTILTDAAIIISGNQVIEDANKKRLEEYKKYLDALQKQYDFETGLLHLQLTNLKEFVNDRGGLFKILAAQKVRLNIQIDIGNGGGSSFDSFTKEIPKISSELQKEVDRLNKTNPITIEFNARIKTTDETKAQIKNNLKSVNDLIKNALDGALSGIGESIGEALAGGDMKNIFGAFVNAIGQGVQAIGKQLITLGTVALAAKLALKQLFSNPALMIAAGIALVAVGSALNKVLGGGLKGFAQGGFTGAGGRNEPAGVVHRGEFVIPAFSVQKLGLGFLNQLAFGGNIRGFQNGGSVSGVVGGGAKVSGVVYVVQRGKDLIGTIDLAKLSQGRL